ncbi:MAG: GNAT family N-acetyltransferase, partial [Rhodoferax sp.]|nr:GNAT family N-acetyltransferase [Rhodoferax sp.]
PAFQGQGWARLMLDALTLWSRGQGAQWVWLEVRVGNPRAIKVYQSHGFRRVGHRKAYYPAANGAREDAIVMSLKL